MVYNITYQNKVKFMKPVLSRQRYIELRGSKNNTETVNAVRGLGKDGKKHLDKKKYLLQMNYSCWPTNGGKLKGSTQCSNSVGMDVDFDGSDNASESQSHAVMNRILSLKDKLGLLLLERSVSKGYHIVFKRRKWMSQEENLKAAAKLLGVKFDANAKDITRVFFTTTAAPEDMIYLSDDLFFTGNYELSEEEKHAFDVEQHEEVKADNEDVNTDTEVVKADNNVAATEVAVMNTKNYPNDYLGIPYSEIIDMWFDLYHDGHKPIKSNRDAMTFELAVNLRNICGHDRNWLDQVIPCYDGFPQDEKMKCIDSAIKRERTAIPTRLANVINAIRAKKTRYGDDSFNSKEWDDVMEEDALFYYNQLPQMPQGVSDSIEGAGHQLAMPTLVAIAPAIGALATNVKLDVHGDTKGLAMTSFIAGEFASGKGKMDGVIGAWMAELQAETDIYNLQEEEWARKASQVKTGNAPEAPVNAGRIIPLNNTTANLAVKLSHVGGNTAFSFTSEADNVAQRWKQSDNDFSVMVRQAYDESRYDREAKSAEAARAHIEHLRWNITMCGTQDALYRVVRNYTDGLLSRIAIGRTPDNTFAPLEDNPAHLTDEQAGRILQIAHLLPFFNGKVVLDVLEKNGRMWLEKIRLASALDYDKTKARLRMRTCVTAMRMTCALWLPKVAEKLIKMYGFNGAELRLKQNPDLWRDMLLEEQTPEMINLFNIIADYLLDNSLFFFGERIEKAYKSRDFSTTGNRSRRGKNDSIYEQLPNEFTFPQACQVAYAMRNATENQVRQMLKNWEKAGLIVKKDSKYVKVQFSAC